MAEAATLAKPAAKAEVTAPTAAEDERLRGLIRAELERCNALPIARRTLELLAEGAIEPTEGEPGYRIVDRRGETRLRELPPDKPGKKADARKPDAKRPEVAPEPLTLADLVEELRGRHPDLFGQRPELPPKPASPAKQGATVQDALAQVRVAGARFVGTQSARAKSLAASSTERGRALADAATQTVGGWRARLTQHKAQQEAPQPARLPAADDTALPSRGASLRQGWTALADRAAARLGSAIPRPNASAPAAPPAAEDADHARRRRQIGLGLGGATAVAVIVALIAVGRQPAETPPTPKETPSQPAVAPPSPVPNPAPRPAAPAPVLPNAAQAPADTELQPPGPDDTPAKAGDLVGVPEIVDTATLRLSGKVVHLFGVEWVRGGQAEELTKYLAGRTVTCQPAPGSSAYLCAVDGRDLSEVVLFNGGGRASPEATPDLAAAEDHARSERLGVWKR